MYAFREKFGARKKWVEHTHKLFREELRLNTLGRWSDGQVFKEHGKPMPYTIGLSIMGSFAAKKNLNKPGYGSTHLKGDVLPVLLYRPPWWMRCCTSWVRSTD